jgi:hypothetical protein
MHVSTDVWLHDEELPEVFPASDPNRASLVVGPTVEPSNVTFYGRRAVLRAWLESALAQLDDLPPFGKCSACGGAGEVPGPEEFSLRSCPICKGAGLKAAG